MALKVYEALSIFLILCNCINLISSASKCDRMPEGTGVAKSPPDGRFRLRISTDPQYYIPGETYNSKMINHLVISLTLQNIFSS